MDYAFQIACGSVVLAIACAFYGIWQARSARIAEHARVEFAHAAAEASEVLKGRLASTESALRRRNERFNTLEADFLAEKKAHSTTKGLLTKAKNQLSAQGAAAKQGG